MAADIRLYGILDPAATPGADLASLARLAAKGGATILQYRDKLAEGRVMVEQARAILAALSDTGVPLLINDRLDVALVAGAQGVHLGQADILPRDARARLGSSAIIGRTLTNEAHIAALAEEPVDYGCIGGVFATSNKTNANPPIGIPGLKRLLSLARKARPDLPLGAIAGITEANAAQVISAGADGIAVIGALFVRPDPLAAAQGLRRIVDGALAFRAREPAT
ncbi:MAG: thiamine phosphate synthase [Hyphomicrobiales bacterium]|nr:thiamine phosphate synthase [Hyphomicrobiales bacterium]MBV8428308.1 thiamine phosphate synthase [Hyphomicrobiales bacterium]MBV9740313.1 thiamine phosphate synthase [Hyphomicrobiales bacterium]